MLVNLQLNVFIVELFSSMKSVLITKRSGEVKFSICCQKEKVQLPFLQRPPELLNNLLNGEDPRSKHFLDNITTYNSMFSFNSIGGKIGSSIIMVLHLLSS